MKKSIIFCSIFITLSINCFAQKNSLEAQVNRYLLEIKDTLIKRDCGVQISYDAPKGSFAISQGANVDNNSVFNIGSTTKFFTALLTLMEIESKRLSLSDTLGMFFPINPNVDGKITIKNLLNHTSGLGEVAFDKNINEAVMNPFSPLNYDFLYFKIPEPNQQKDISHKYCNTNYILLSYILEQLNDASFEAIVKEKIIDKFGLRNTYGMTSRKIQKLAHPHFMGQDLYEVIPNRFFVNMCAGAGAIASNTSDVNKVFKLFLEGKIISNESVAKMMTLEVISPEYGFGFHTKKIEGNIFWSHDGDNIGYCSRNYIDIDNKKMLTIMFNTMDRDVVKQVTKGIRVIIFSPQNSPNK